MKNILILADGIVAKHFLERVIENYATENNYNVVYYNEKVLPKSRNSNMKFFFFDPTSYVKLSQLFDEDFHQVHIIMANKIDTIASYNNIRKLSKQVNIVLFDKWNLEIEDQNLIKLDANEILANRLIDFLPNIPIVAQNVGLGIGEIMEVLVPFGSSYVYRHIGSIEQKKWKIAAIYRNNRLLIAEPSIMIWPNDLLLLIGEPNVLKNIYKSIKREVGQFPIPYGTNSYLFIDMEKQRAEEIEKVLHDAVWLHKNLKDKKLIIRVINPSDFKVLDMIKQLDSKDIDVEIKYASVKEPDIIIEDCRKFDIGLIIVKNSLFEKYEIRETLFQTKLPVFSISDKDIEKISQSALLLSKNKELEKISSPILDVSVQLKLNLILYDIDPEESDKSEIIEHFENLASIFSKSIKVVKANKNPIREMQKIDNFLQFLPFNRKILKKPLIRFFSTDVECLYYKLSSYHQIFIPVQV
ncbi:COG3400 family protein [Nitrosophilus alvini]|uniref:COG3400 family protein n=1 Tax=Nitrosophilus alvini TaxID=2714855 RepID=UPI00190D669C|nr:TrkA C-terminal domain-containing protein [Nitrosophilus alvini]